MKFLSRLTPVWLLLSLLLPVQLASAQVLSVEPGRWQHNVDLSSQSGRLEAALDLARMQMALLPEAQQQRIKDMLQRQGIQFDLVNQSFQNCVTEEEATTGEFDFMKQGGCELTRVNEVGQDTEVSFVCAQGQGELVLRDGRSYTGTSSMTLEFGGIIEEVTASHRGSWVGASCAATQR